MTKKAIIERTLWAINQLPDDKAEEISEFAAFVFKRYDESRLVKGIQQMASESQSFTFLEEEEEIYTLEDVKAPYNG